MQDAIVTLKDGRVYRGAIWLWRPEENYFTITSCEDTIRINLKEVAKAVIPNFRVSEYKIEELDLLEKARCDLACPAYRRSRGLYE